MSLKCQDEKSRKSAFFLIFLGLLFNPVTFVYFFSSITGDSLEIGNKIILSFVTFFFVAAGLIIIKYGRTAQQRKQLLFIILLIVMSLVVIEVGLHLIVLIIKPTSFVSQKMPFEHLINNPIFKAQEDPETLLKEWSELPVFFKPFLVWDRKEYHGKFFNISKEGVRITWNPDFAGDSPAKIYAFGGSTMWGAGVSDYCTVASYLSKKLNEEEAIYEVVNYGEMGYTFAQGVIQLILLLREGHRPDYVVFYDGVNDVYAGYQAGKAELIQNSDIIAEKFEAKEVPAFNMILMGLKKAWDDHFMIGKLLKVAIAKYQKPFSEIASDYRQENIDFLAKDISDSYLKSYQLLEKITEAYNIKFVCFWQPSGFLEETLFDEEYNSSPRFKSPGYKDLSLKTRTYLFDNAPGNLIDISTVLKNRQSPFYFDFCHISEEGNKVVASEIATVLKQKILSREH